MVTDFYLKLNDNVIVYPAHGNCTSCGEVFDQRLSSTIGYEWRFNSFFQFYDVASFTDYVLSSILPTRQVGSNISGTRSWLHNASSKSLSNLYPPCELERAWMQDGQQWAQQMTELLKQAN